LGPKNSIKTRLKIVVDRSDFLSYCLEIKGEIYMSKTIHLMVAKIEAEKRLVEMDVNDPFHSAYTDFLAEVDEWINHYDKVENENRSQYFGRKCFRV
jgi:hypothetical protein